jgi:hypothetical protein
MYALAQGLRFAFRQLWKAPGVSLTVVFTLALGIGATTAIFSLVEGILLRPLPFSDPDRLVLVGDHLGGSPNIPVTAREIGKYANATSAFSSLGGYIGANYFPARRPPKKSTLLDSPQACSQRSTFALCWAASLRSRKRTHISRSP